MSFALLGGLLTALAWGGECDAGAIAARMEETSPIRVGQVYAELAACDPARARKQVGAMLDRMLLGDGTEQALVLAIDYGAGERVGKWLDAQEPDQRSRIIGKLGDHCDESPAVADYLVAAKDRLGERFWQERWQRALATCRTDSARTLLTAALDDPDHGRNSRDRTGFRSLLEVYARNLGADAVPTLTEIVRANSEDREVTFFLGMYAEAANIGSTEPRNEDAVRAGVAALQELGPELSPAGVDRARGVLVALGAQDAADRYVVHRWPDRFQEGVYAYGMVVLEKVTCGNAKEQAVIHRALVSDPGLSWPDQLAPRAEALARGGMVFDAAERCRGTETLQVVMSDEPMTDAAAAAGWLDARQQELTAPLPSSVKTRIIEHPPIVTR